MYNNEVRNIILLEKKIYIQKEIRNIRQTFNLKMLIFQNMSKQPGHAGLKN